MGWRIATDNSLSDTRSSFLIQSFAFCRWLSICWHWPIVWGFTFCLCWLWPAASARRGLFSVNRAPAVFTHSRPGLVLNNHYLAHISCWTSLLGWLPISCTLNFNHTRATGKILQIISFTHFLQILVAFNWICLSNKTVVYFRYSRNHTHLNPNEEPFWRFSWDQMGRFDLPAMLDRVSKFFLTLSNFCTCRPWKWAGKPSWCTLDTVWGQPRSGWWWTGDLGWTRR